MTPVNRNFKKRTLAAAVIIGFGAPLTAAAQYPELAEDQDKASLGSQQVDTQQAAESPAEPVVEEPAAEPFVAPAENTEPQPAPEPEPVVEQPPPEPVPEPAPVEVAPEPVPEPAPEPAPVEAAPAPEPAPQPVVEEPPAPELEPVVEEPPAPAPEPEPEPVVEEPPAEPEVVEEPPAPEPVETADTSVEDDEPAQPQVQTFQATTTEAEDESDDTESDGDTVEDESKTENGNDGDGNGEEPGTGEDTEPDNGDDDGDGPVEEDEEDDTEDEPSEPEVETGNLDDIEYDEETGTGTATLTGSGFRPNEELDVTVYVDGQRYDDAQYTVDEDGILTVNVPGVDQTTQRVTYSYVRDGLDYDDRTVVDSRRDGVQHVERPDLSYDDGNIYAAGLVHNVLYDLRLTSDASGRYLGHHSFTTTEDTYQTDIETVQSWWTSLWGGLGPGGYNLTLDTDEEPFFGTGPLFFEIPDPADPDPGSGGDGPGDGGFPTDPGPGDGGDGPGDPGDGGGDGPGGPGDGGGDGPGDGVDPTDPSDPYPGEDGDDDPSGPGIPGEGDDGDDGSQDGDTPDGDGGADEDPNVPGVGGEDDELGDDSGQGDGSDENPVTGNEGDDDIITDLADLTAGLNLDDGQDGSGGDGDTEASEADDEPSPTEDSRTDAFGDLQTAMDNNDQLESQSDDLPLASDADTFFDQDVNSLLSRLQNRDSDEGDADDSDLDVFSPSPEASEASDEPTHEPQPEQVNASSGWLTGIMIALGSGIITLFAWLILGKKRRGDHVNEG